MEQKPVAFITGASKGIGAAIAVDLAKAGYNLALTARHDKLLQTVANQCEEYGAETLVLPADITDRSLIQKNVQKIIARFGKLNALIINHGTTVPNGKFVDDINDQWDTIIDVNLKASLYITRITLPHLIATSKDNSHDCAILFVSSVAGKQGFGDFVAYCASKFGLRGFAQGLFEEVREFGIKVITVCPGWVNTDMATQSGVKLDSQKMIQPEDIGGIIKNLLQMPATSCPTEIEILPQRSPYI